MHFAAPLSVHVSRFDFLTLRVIIASIHRFKTGFSIAESPRASPAVRLRMQMLRDRKCDGENEPESNTLKNQIYARRWVSFHYIILGGRR